MNDILLYCESQPAFLIVLELLPKVPYYGIYICSVHSRARNNFKTENSKNARLTLWGARRNLDPEIALGGESYEYVLLVVLVLYIAVQLKPTRYAVKNRIPCSRRLKDRVTTRF